MKTELQGFYGSFEQTTTTKAATGERRSASDVSTWTTDRFAGKLEAWREGIEAWKADLKVELQADIRKLEKKFEMKLNLEQRKTVPMQLEDVSYSYAGTNMQNKILKQELEMLRQQTLEEIGAQTSSVRQVSVPVCRAVSVPVQREVKVPVVREVSVPVSSEVSVPVSSEVLVPQHFAVTGSNVRTLSRYRSRDRSNVRTLSR